MVNGLLRDLIYSPLPHASFCKNCFFTPFLLFLHAHPYARVAFDSLICHNSCARAVHSSIASVIAQDVHRTKMDHPLFSAGGQGMGMLQRVLLRCEELRAVEEAGYVQVCLFVDENPGSRRQKKKT